MCVCSRGTREPVFGECNCAGPCAGANAGDCGATVGSHQYTRQCDDSAPLLHIHWWTATGRRCPETTVLSHSRRHTRQVINLEKSTVVIYYH